MASARMRSRMASSAKENEEVEPSLSNSMRGDSKLGTGQGGPLESSTSDQGLTLALSLFEKRSCVRRRKSKLETSEREEEKEQEQGTSSTERIFVCDRCKQTYKTESALRRHRAADHRISLDGSPLPEKTFKCKFCFASFGFRLELQRHSALCFPRLELLEKRRDRPVKKKRLTIAHSARNDRPVKDKSCPVCQRQFQTMQMRNAHIASKHPEEEEDIRQRPETYITSKEYQEARPFVCGFCERRYATPSTLAAHNRLTLDPVTTTRFSCAKCGKTFALRSDLERHERRMADLPMCRKRGRQPKRRD